MDMQITLEYSDNAPIMYLCEDTPDGIFTAIYDAWASGIPEQDVRLEIEANHAMELFTTYRYVQTELDKAVKVARSVRHRLGAKAYQFIYYAALSYERDKINVIYHFLKQGFSCGPEISAMHGLPEVCRIFEISRNVSNESHYYREFVRFHESSEGVLIARISPKNQVLPLLAEHFADRFPEEHFVILDETNHMGLFHEKGKDWYLSPLEAEVLSSIWEHRQPDEYSSLWKTFFQTIAIKERRNYQCQRNMCALRYRDYMVEFH